MGSSEGQIFRECSLQLHKVANRKVEGSDIWWYDSNATLSPGRPRCHVRLIETLYKCVAFTALYGRLEGGDKDWCLCSQQRRSLKKLWGKRANRVNDKTCFCLLFDTTGVHSNLYLILRYTIFLPQMCRLEGSELFTWVGNGFDTFIKVKTNSLERTVVLHVHLFL